MSSQPSHHIDTATRNAIAAFVERVGTRNPLHETILFGSRARHWIDDRINVLARCLT